MQQLNVLYKSNALLTFVGPSNPPEVKSWFYGLRENWGDVATYLGYSKDDLEEVVTEMEKNPESQIVKFLALFKMPDCGTRTLPILHKLADFAGVVRKKHLTHQLHHDKSGMFDISFPSQDNVGECCPACN